MTSYKKIKLTALTKILDDYNHYDKSDSTQIKSKKWDLIIDPSTRASVFLQYRNGVFIDVLNKAALSKERLTDALLGAVNYGKEIIFNLENNVAFYDFVKDSFENLEKGLFEKVMSKDFDIEKLSYTLQKIKDPTLDIEDRQVQLKLHQDIKTYEGFKVIFVIKSQDNLESILGHLEPVLVTLD